MTPQGIVISKHNILKQIFAETKEQKEKKYIYNCAQR
jgi:hypothetical protein